MYCLVTVVIVVALAACQVSAQCGGVELLADGRSFTTTTLYIPLGSSGSFVTCRCTGSGTPTWTYSNGSTVPSCTSLYTAVCSNGVYLESQNLTFTQLVAGRYDCNGGGYTASITIFGELSHTMYFSIPTQFPINS